MSITYTYDIGNIKVYSKDGIDNIVSSYTFYIMATDGDVMRQSFFPVQLNEPNQNNFIQYSDLTKQKMIDWTINMVGQNQIDALEEGLAGVILDAVNLPPVPQPIDPPWGK